MPTTFPVTSKPFTAKAARDAKALKKAKGYITNFIQPAVHVNDALLNKTKTKLLPAINAGDKGRLNYEFNSVYYNSARRMPFYSAYNINLDKKSKGRRAANFIIDPRIDAGMQLNQPFYNLIKKNDKDFDIGHMAGCDEMAWNVNGQLQSLQTFFFPNTCPQAKDLNEKLWNQVERKLVAAQKGKEEGNICVFTGPIFKKDDPLYKKDPTVQLPLRFFKVIVFSFEGKIYSTGIVMSHKELLKRLGLFAPTAAPKGLTRGLTPVTPIDDFPHKGIYQVNVSTISKETGIQFKWDNVIPVKIKERFHQLEDIDKHETPEDVKGLTRGFIAPKSKLTSRNPYGFVLVK